MSGPGDRVRDRRVLALLAGCVLVVLGADVLSALVPGLDPLVAGAPVLVVVLVVATVGVLGWSVARDRRR